MRREDNGDYVLSNGKTLSAPLGIIGIDSESAFIHTRHGAIDDGFSDNEIVEICDFMIALWSEKRQEHDYTPRICKRCGKESERIHTCCQDKQYR